jgi:dienelactone hydrolase
MEIETQDAHFYTGPRTRLAARTYLPPEGRALGLGVVMCHGFGGVKEGVLPSLAKELASAGYTALTFDFRGFGGSEGVAGRLVPAEQAEDAVHALEFMATAGEVDPERIALYGTSFGGGVAALAAGRKCWLSRCRSPRAATGWRA